jgi:hypothetical protein
MTRPPSRPIHRLALLLVVPCALLCRVPAAPAATRTGIPALDVAAATVAALPADGNARSLAAHISDEGHWTLVNRAGEAFTAASPEELKRGLDILLPASAPGALQVQITPASVFRQRQRLADLPPDATLTLAPATTAMRSQPLVLLGTGASLKPLAELRPNLLLELSDADTYADVVRQLARPLDRSGFRLLSIEPGGPKTFNPKRHLDRVSGRYANDAIDPTALLQAIANLSGQTAVIVGRLDGDTLTVKPAATPERTLRWPELVEAAVAGDVNLLLLRSDSGQQPGARNWLWQKIEVKGLDTAMAHATLADFFDALGSPSNRLVVTATAARDDTLRLDVHRVSGLPAAQSRSAQVGNAIGGALADLVSSLAGKVVHDGAVMHLRSTSRQTELDRRLISFLPALVQWGYAALLAVGLMGLPVAWRWWGRLWPSEKASEYQNRLGYGAARLIRGLAFATLFLPLSALAAGPVGVLEVLRGKRRRAIEKV